MDDPGGMNTHAQAAIVVGPITMWQSPESGDVMVKHAKLAEPFAISAQVLLRWVLRTLRAEVL